MITSDDVTVENLAVTGGEIGIEIDGAENVKIEHVRVSGTSLDAIQARRASVTIRDCLIHSPVGDYAQGIDISFGFDLPPSLIEGCTIVGGREGIVTHFSNVHIRSNHVSQTTLRALGLTEMSMVMVEGNDVQNSLGVGIYCGDYSECMISDNVVGGTRPDTASGTSRASDSRSSRIPEQKPRSRTTSSRATRAHQRRSSARELPLDNRSSFSLGSARSIPLTRRKNWLARPCSFVTTAVRKWTKEKARPCV